jgi:hypothetical protein
MFEAYRNRMAQHGSNMGEMLRRQSNMVVEQTWTNDPNYKQVYVVKVDSGLPKVTDVHELIDVKFNIDTYPKLTADEPAYLLQFRHGAEKRNPEIGLGSYVYMSDEDGKWKWWLICYLDERPFFRQYHILECNYTFKWINEGKIYECLGVQRIQQSYNSGSWSGDRFDFVDNITSAILPTNNDTVTIGYNHRFMITDPRRPIPLVWMVSKVEDSTPIGLTELKFTQETYSPTLDNKELMLCNYYDSPITPEILDTQTELQESVTITYNGTTPTVKVGGSQKIFTAIFHADDVVPQSWLLSDENGAITENMSDYTIEYEGNKMKLKVARDYNLIGKVLILQVIGTDGSSGELKVEVVG